MKNFGRREISAPVPQFRNTSNGYSNIERNNPRKN
jgi:hypothetical protein